MNENLMFSLGELKRIADCLVRLSENESLPKKISDELYYHAAMLLSTKIALSVEVYNLAKQTNDILASIAGGT